MICCNAVEIVFIYFVFVNVIPSRFLIFLQKPFLNVQKIDLMSLFPNGRDWEWFLFVCFDIYLVIYLFIFCFYSNMFVKNFFLWFLFVFFSFFFCNLMFFLFVLFGLFNVLILLIWNFYFSCLYLCIDKFLVFILW